MRYLFGLLFCLAATTLSAQPVLLSTKLFPGYRTDSFYFAKQAFPLQRTCDTADNATCCAFHYNPEQVGCYNGTSLLWNYCSTPQNALDNLYNIIAQLSTQSALLTQEPVTGFLLNNKVKGYRLKMELKDGSDYSHIIMVTGIVNNQPVLIQLYSLEALLTNEQVPPTIRQVFRFQ